jgi:hypothetical protein
MAAVSLSLISELLLAFELRHCAISDQLDIFIATTVQTLNSAHCCFVVCHIAEAEALRDSTLVHSEMMSTKSTKVLKNSQNPLIILDRSRQVLNKGICE